VAKMENFDFTIRSFVKSFTLIVSKNGTYKEEKSTNSKFTEKMKAILSRPEVGQRIIFEDIVVEMPGGVDREIASLKLIIKD
jgi:hypothetical protein